jgi:hypothetical protein
MDTVDRLEAYTAFLPPQVMELDVQQREATAAPVAQQAAVVAEPDAQQEVAAEPLVQQEAAVVAELGAQPETTAAAAVEAPCVQQAVAVVAAIPRRVRPPAALAEFAATEVGPHLEASCCLMTTTVRQILMAVVRL